MRLIRVAKAGLLVATLVPAAMLGVGIVTIAPFTYYPRYVINDTGDWGLRFLVLTLCVTPVRRLTGWHSIIQLRRTIGLAAFFYSAAHLVLWVILFWDLQVRAMVAAIVASPFLWIGLIAFLLLVPLAVTSNRASMSALGWRWRKLHWLTYAATVPTLVHFWLRGPYAAVAVRKWIVIVAVLLGLRLYLRDTLRRGLMTKKMLGVVMWCALGSAVGAALAQAPTEGPEGTNFWRVPARAAAGAKPGDILWTRARADAPVGSRGWNLIYVSESATGALVYVSGEIYIPQAPGPEGPRPLIVWNHGTAGSQDACAPSRNNVYVDPGHTRVPALESLLKRGYVVTMSDYQGLGTPGGAEYLDGPAQGRAALDVARAARNFEPARVGNRVGMYGFSQGGQTVLWAAHLAATYAPELQLVGILPVAPAARHLDLSFYDLGIPQNSGYFISRMAGLAVGHAEVKLRDMLTPAGLEILDANSWGCYEIFARAAQLNEPYAKREALEPGTAWRALLEANDRFLPLPATVPILMLQGDRDVDVPVTLIRELRRDLCQQRGLLDYREFQGVDHLGMNEQSAPLITDWFEARFGGVPAPGNCPN